jgi:hypothetical protein
MKASSRRAWWRVPLLMGGLLCVGGVFTTAYAQKTAPAITRDSDRDGVPDPRDRCAATPAGTRVDPNGCPAVAPAPAPAAQAPTAAPSGAQAPPVTTQAQREDSTRRRPSGLPSPSPAPANAAAAQPPAREHPSGLPTPSGGAAVSAPSAAAPAPSAAPAPTPARRRPTRVVVIDPSQTAGFWLPAFSGTTDAEQLDYAKTLVLKFDSAVVALIAIYQNTSGNPVAGATDPSHLSSREKARWLRCRNVANDIRNLGEAVDELRDSIAGGPTLQREAATMAQAFDSLHAIEGCDLINSMIESPERFSPWQANYESEAHHFYANWYGEVRAAHLAVRDFARVLNGALAPDRRFPVPPAIPAVPPYIGAVR